MREGENMKIAISAMGNDMDATVDQRFGRCNYFVIVDTDSMKFELLSNEGAMASGGAGIQTAQKIANSGVSAIITGNVGPNAFQTLSAAGIKVIVGANGTVKESVEKYMKGELKEIEAASVGSHFGMGR